MHLAIWERLAAAAPIDDVKASPLGDAWQRTAPELAHRIVVAQRAGAPAGLLVLARAAAPRLVRRLASAADDHWQCAYPITGPDVVGDTRALLTQLAREGGWDELVLGPMLADGASLRAVEAAGRALGMRPLVTGAGHALRVVLRGTWDAYFAERSARLRSDARQGERRLAKLGPVALDDVRGGAALDAALDAFFRVEATGWKLAQRTAIACDPQLRARYVALARAAADRGQLRVFVLRAGGAAVAASFCIEHARDVYQLKTGYDAAHGKASPGQVLHMRMLQALWAAGEVRSFDFASRTAEHGGYKERWANDSRAYAVVRLFRPRRLRGQMLAQVVRLRLAARAYL